MSQLKFDQAEIDNRTAEIVDIVKKCVDNYCDENNIQIRDFAKQAKVSPKHLSDILSRKRDMTLSDYTNIMLNCKLTTHIKFVDK